MTNEFNVAEHLADLTDAELLRDAATCRDDLAKASSDEPNRDWHGACFAGAFMFATELQRRGLTLATIH